MNFEELKNNLQNLTNGEITYQKIADALGRKLSTISTRKNNGSQVKFDELKKLEKYFDVVLTDSSIKTAQLINEIENKNRTNFKHSSFYFPDRIEIGYYKYLPDNLKNNRVSSLWFDREIIENIWNVKSDSLVIITMLGDNLSSYKNNDYPIKNKDILIVDCSQTNIMVRGVYFATSRQNSRFWVREMELKLNDSIDFYSYTPNGKIVKSYSKEELNNADFRIVGKVIKNISFKM